MSAVFDVDAAAVSEPLVAVSVFFDEDVLAADFEAGFLAAGFAFDDDVFAAGFAFEDDVFAAGFFAAGFFAVVSLFFSSAMAYLSSPLDPAPECARKVRVGANSPSLWPTIDSEM